MEQVDADIGNLFEKLDSWVDGFIRLLPNIVLATVVIAIFVGLGFFVGKIIRKRAESRDRHSLGEVANSLARWAFGILGVMLGVTIVAPSVTLAELFAGLGVSSVAIGFAFKDILQNMLAGILILLRQPFTVGDEIVSGGHTGKVEKIETRATFITTYDGRRVVIPIADSSNNIRVRWWTKSARSEVIHTSGRVIEAVYKKLDENGIDMPYPTNVIPFHD